MNPSALKTTTILENSGCKRKGDKGDPVQAGGMDTKSLPHCL